MNKETKIKSSLFRTLCAITICIFFIIVKFILKDEKIVTDIYNYLSSDIVFLR